MNEYLEIEKSLGNPLNAYDHPTTLSHRFVRIQLPLGKAYYLPLGQPPAVCSHETAPIYMSAVFERTFGARFKQPDILANPFPEDVRPYLKGLNELLRTDSPGPPAARMGSEPARAELYVGNAVRLRNALGAIRQGLWQAGEGGSFPTRSFKAARKSEEPQAVQNVLTHQFFL